MSTKRSPSSITISAVSQKSKFYGESSNCPNFSKYILCDFFHILENNKLPSQNQVVRLHFWSINGEEKREKKEVEGNGPKEP